MATDRLPPQEFLRECFDYDPETGLFRWRHRPDRHFVSPEVASRWRTRFAGCPTFTSTDKNGYKRAEVRHEGREYCLRANMVAWKLMTGEEHPMIDHRDCDPSNDKLVNLRPASATQNNANRAGCSKLGLPKGVTTKRGKFMADGRRDGERYYLGMFGTPSEAHAAYCAWAKASHGEFFNAG